MVTLVRYPDVSSLNPEVFPLTLRLFGSYDLQQNGRPLPRTRTRTEQWLLALLILRHDQRVERAWLAAQFWPDSAENQALYNLRRSLSDLRRVLDTEAYRLASPTPQTIRLDLSGASVDVVAFDAAVARGDTASLEKAVELYRGPLLEGCLEEWALLERDRRAEAYLAALETLAARAASRQNHAEAVRCLRQAVLYDPLRETAQQELLRSLAALGDFAGACAAYHRFRACMKETLQSEPTQETSALYRQIRRESRQRRSLSNPNIPGTPPPLALTAAPPQHLPCPLTTLIGREKEVEAVENHLASTRLLTLVGTGGIGKTRLAIAIADEVADEYTDGVWWVALAALTTQDRVPQTVAAALGVSAEQESALLPALAHHLQHKSLLLILDNCEHLVADCAHLADTLLGCCPGLRILATSRQSLGVMGEHVWRVPSLSLPVPVPFPEVGYVDVSHLMESESVRLFTERARAAYPSFQVTMQNAAYIAQICRLLDGIPLALELAAAWTRALTVEQIAGRLDHRFQLLTGGSRTALPHQQTLRATLDWSYRLLSEKEQALLCRLSVFVDGWTLEAAEAICTEAGGQEAAEITAGLAELTDKSLVVFEAHGGQARYYLLETTREYAAEQWSPEDRKVISRRHADYFLRLALVPHKPAEGHSGKLAWHIGLKSEQENLRAALAWWRCADVGTGAGLALALWQGGMLSYHSPEAREWIARLQHEELPPTPASSVLYRAVGEWACWLGEGLAARTLWEKALTAATLCKDRASSAETLLLLGADDIGQEEYLRAQERYESGLASFEALGDIRQAAKARNGLGRLAFRQGDRERARCLLTESLEIGRQQGDQSIVLDALEEMAFQAHLAKEYDGAQAYLLEYLEVQRPARNYQTANILRGLGALAGAQGEYERAWSYLHEALALHRECGFRPGEGWDFYDMAQLAQCQGDSALAQEYLTQGLRLFEALGEKGSVQAGLQLQAQRETFSQS